MATLLRDPLPPPETRYQDNRRREPLPNTSHRAGPMKYSFAPGTSPLPGYTVRRAISRGAFGEVYYALSDSGRETALKLIQNNLDVELRGIRQCLNLAHPNLVTIFDVRQDADGDYWIVMEYVPGGSLADALRGRPDGFSPEEAVAWVDGIAAAVDYLHARGLVHRDLKPGNVLRDEVTGVVKVGDVGLSKFITASKRSANTQSVGTVYYMAPEVANGRYGPEVDQYALAVMAFELLTGRVPFEGETTGEILLKHLSGTPDVSGLPKSVRPVIARALSKTPEDRFGSVAEFAQAFRAVAPGASGSATFAAEAHVEPPPSGQSTPPRVPRTTEELKAEAAKLMDPKVQAAIGRQINDDLNYVAEKASGWPMWAKVLTFLFGMSLTIGVLRGDSDAGRFVSMMAIGYIAFRGFKYFTQGMISTPEGPLAARPDSRPFEATFVRPAEAAPSPRMLAASAAMAPVIVVALTAAAALFDYERLGGSEEAVGAFALSAIVGSWSLLGIRKWLSGSEPSFSGQPRLLSGITGLVIGMVTAAAVQFVNVELPGVNRGDVIFGDIGSAALIAENVPTPVGVAVFFSGLFLLRNWLRQTDPWRVRRLRVGSVLMSVFVAVLVSRVFAFPAEWAALWAGVTSVTVQLVSPWVSRADRRRLADAGLSGAKGWV